MRQLYLVFFVLLQSMMLSSCAPIARLFSVPTYSSHSYDKIQLHNKNIVSNVYIKHSASDGYGIYQKVIEDLTEKLNKYNIRIVNSPDKANYILSVNIRNISIDVDYDFANSMRNSLLANEINPDFVFDKNNSPHINAEIINSFNKNSVKKTYKRILPSTLYTLIGAGAGGVLGYFLAGSVAPLAIATGAGIVAGGMTYLIYNEFRNTGVVVSYDIVVEEKMNKNLPHNRKSLIKASSNMADEVYYSYTDNWNPYSSKNVVIAIGSRALLKDMVEHVCPLIAENVISQLNIQKTFE